MESGAVALFLLGARRLLDGCRWRVGKVFRFLGEAERPQLVGLGLAGVALGDVFGHRLLADGCRLFLLLETQVSARAGGIPRVLNQDLIQSREL